MSNTVTIADIKAAGNDLHAAAVQYYNARRDETQQQRSERVWTLQFLWEVMNKPVYANDLRTKGRVIGVACTMLRGRGLTDIDVPGITKAEQFVAQLRQDGAI